MILATTTTVDASGGAKQSPPLICNPQQGSFSLSWAAVVSGTVSYTVEHTLDGVTWIANADTTGGKTATLDGYYLHPILQLRLNQASGSGSIVLTVLQSSE